MRYFVFNRPDIVAPWVWDRTGGAHNPKSDVAIGYVEAGKLIAGVVYESYYPGASIAMHVAAEPGKRWATHENLRVWFEYPFKQLQVGKVLAPVRGSNLVAQKFNEHLGFIRETHVCDVCAPGEDLLVYTMTRDQCRFLGD